MRRRRDPQKAQPLRTKGTERHERHHARRGHRADRRVAAARRALRGARRRHHQPQLPGHASTARPGQPGVGKFVLRIPGDGTDTFIDREREHRNHVAAAAAGVTPAGLHLIQPGPLFDRALHRRRDHAPRDHRRTPRPPPADRRRRSASTTTRPSSTTRSDVFDMIRDYTHDGPRGRTPHARADSSRCSRSADAHRAGHGARQARAASPATTTCSPRTSSSTPTARCGSSTGSTAA